jgi:hypothetical protein
MLDGRRPKARHPTSPIGPGGYAKARTYYLEPPFRPLPPPFPDLPSDCEWDWCFPLLDLPSPFLPLPLGLFGGVLRPRPAERTEEPGEHGTSRAKPRRTRALNHWVHHDSISFRLWCSRQSLGHEASRHPKDGQAELTIVWFCKDGQGTCRLGSRAGDRARWQCRRSSNQSRLDRRSRTLGSWPVLLHLTLLGSYLRLRQRLDRDVRLQRAKLPHQILGMHSACHRQQNQCGNDCSALFAQAGYALSQVRAQGSTTRRNITAREQRHRHTANRPRIPYTPGGQDSFLIMRLCADTPRSRKRYTISADPED